MVDDFWMHRMFFKECYSNRFFTDSTSVCWATNDPNIGLHCIEAWITAIVKISITGFIKRPQFHISNRSLVTINPNKVSFDFLIAQTYPIRRIIFKQEQALMESAAKIWRHTVFDCSFSSCFKKKQMVTILCINLLSFQEFGRNKFFVDFFIKFAVHLEPANRR